MPFLGNHKTDALSGGGDKCPRCFHSKMCHEKSCQNVHCKEEFEMEISRKCIECKTSVDFLEGCRTHAEWTRGKWGDDLPKYYPFGKPDHLSKEGLYDHPHRARKEICEVCLMIKHPKIWAKKCGPDPGWRKGTALWIECKGVCPSFYWKEEGYVKG